MAVMFITHDMGVIAEVADRVMVMYAGSIVEEAPVKQFFANPLHPYSMGLLKAVPRPDEKKERLFMIEGTVPKLSEEIIGCRFCGRCGCAADICTEQKPPLVDAEQGQKVLCWQYAMEGR